MADPSIPTLLTAPEPADFELDRFFGNDDPDRLPDVDAVVRSGLTQPPYSQNGPLTDKNAQRRSRETLGAGNHDPIEDIGLSGRFPVRGRARRRTGEAKAFVL